MTRYFFHVQDGGLSRDEDGVECVDMHEVRKAAMGLLPAIALDEIPDGEDRRTFTVVVKDETERAVYAVTLTVIGIDLTQ